MSQNIICWWLISAIQNVVCAGWCACYMDIQVVGCTGSFTSVDSHRYMDRCDWHWQTLQWWCVLQGKVQYRKSDEEGRCLVVVGICTVVLKMTDLPVGINWQVKVGYRESDLLGMCSSDPGMIKNAIPVRYVSRRHRHGMESHFCLVCTWCVW